MPRTTACSCASRRRIRSSIASRRGTCSRASGRRRSMKSRREMQRALAIALLVSGVGGIACRQDMHNGPRFKALQKSDFYDDHRSERPLIEDTVPRGWLMADDAFATGKVNGQFVAQLPVPLNLQLLQRG